MNWDDLRVFLAVHRHESHGAAGRSLGVDPTTIGRRLRTLEADLGARLFVRSATGLVPTDAARRLLSKAERIEQEILAAGRELGGEDRALEGTVRITAPDGLTQYVLVPALTDLRRRHPDLVVELDTDVRVLDLSRREADVAVRFFRPKEPSLVARKLATVPFGLYASRDYLERHGTPRSTADLGAHTFIGFVSELESMPQVGWLHRLVRPLAYGVRTTTTTGQAAACANGLGIALLPVYVGARDARLVPLLPRLVGPTRETWLVVHQDMKKNARVETTMVWLTQVVLRAVGEA